MNNYLKRYRVTITALSPIHVGSGQKIGKKEYLYLRNTNKVIIPDIRKMYDNIRRKGLEHKFQSYMTDYRKDAPYLEGWLRDNGYAIRDYAEWKKYELDAGDAIANDRPKEIQTFTKDAYGMPYVPGSSIKGMLRTALIAWELKRNPMQYEKIAGQIEDVFDRRDENPKRLTKKNCLQQETKQMEQEILYTLEKNTKRRSDAVNDKLAGIRVGDSDPIAVEQLTLCQKIDLTLTGNEKTFSLIRECLVPDTKICFDLTIDTTLDTYSIEQIIDAINEYHTMCNEYFYQKFQRGVKQENIIWLGGGCGFAPKTVLHALYDDKKAVRVIDQIYRVTLGKQYQGHHHDKDIERGVAPHVCKCTRYHGELYDMGLARLEYEEVE